MRSHKNHYELLGVSPTATNETIKKAFRKLALKHHPDKNPSATAEVLFKEISSAYKILTNPHSRKQYDATLANTISPTKTARPSTKNTATSTGKNLLYNLTLSLEEGFSGLQKTISYVRTIHGKRQTSTVEVTIPAGIRDGKKLRVRGAGESLSPAQTPGDLVVVIHLAEHLFYKLEEADIILTWPISPLDLLPTGPQTIPSLHGPQTVDNIPLDEFQHPTLKLKGKGYPLSERGVLFGDMFVRFVIDVPPILDENLKDKLRQLKKSLPKTARQQTFEKLLRS